MKSSKSMNAVNSSTLQLHGHSNTLPPTTPLAAAPSSMAPIATTPSGGDCYDHHHHKSNDGHTHSRIEDGKEHQYQHQSDENILNHELHRLIHKMEPAPLAATAVTAAATSGSIAATPTTTARTSNNNTNARNFSSTSNTGKKRSVFKMRLFKIFKKKQSKNSKKSNSKPSSKSTSDQPLTSQSHYQQQSHSRSRSQSLLLRQRQELEKSSLATLGTIDLSISDDVHCDRDHHNHLCHDYVGGGGGNIYNYDYYEEEEEEDQHGLSSSCGSALSAMQLSRASSSTVSFSSSHTSHNSHQSHHSHQSYENNTSHEQHHPQSNYEASETSLSTRSAPSTLDLNLNSSQNIFNFDDGHDGDDYDDRDGDKDGDYDDNDNHRHKKSSNTTTMTVMDNDHKKSQCRVRGNDSNEKHNNNNSTIGRRDRDVELENLSQSQHENSHRQPQHNVYSENDCRDNKRQHQQQEVLEQQNEYEYENQKIIALFQAGKEMYTSGSYQMALQMQKQALRVVRSITATATNLEQSLNLKQSEFLTASSTQQKENQFLHERQAAMIEYEIAKIEFVIYKEKKYYSPDNHDENNDVVHDNHDDNNDYDNNTKSRENNMQNDTSDSNYSDSKLSYLYDRMKNAKCVVSLQDVAYYQEKLSSIGKVIERKTFHPQQECNLYDHDCNINNEQEQKPKLLRGRRRRQQQKQKQQQELAQTQQLHQQHQPVIVQVLEKEEIYQKIHILHALAKLCHKDLHKFNEALEYYNQALELECAVLSHLTDNNTKSGTDNADGGSGGTCSRNSSSASKKEGCNSHSLSSNIVIYDQNQNQGSSRNNDGIDTHRLTELYRDEEIKEWKMKMRKTKKKIGAIHYLNGQFDMALFSSFSFGCQ